MGKKKEVEGKKELEDTRTAELKMHKRYKRETVNRKDKWKKEGKTKGTWSKMYRKSLKS